MSGNSLVLVGNLVDAPEVKVTASGTVRTRFRLASTERRRDPSTDTWQDGDSLFMQVTCWRRLAEHVGNSLEKGDRVIVTGRLRQWVAEKDGVRRTMHEIDAEAVGPDLQRGVVSISRNRRPVGGPSATDAAPAPEAPSEVFGEPVPESAALDFLAAGAESDPEPDRAPDWLPPLAEVAG
jgi:single-strand DNA-binding protein